MLPEHDPQIRDQVTRLVSVLRQLATSQHAPVRHTARYDHLVWLDDLRAHLRCGDEILRLARPVGAPEPPAPRSIRRWLRSSPPRPGAEDVVAPTLRDRGPLHGRHVQLVDAPGVRDAYERWMARIWLPWAAAERRRRPVQRMHEQLVEMYRTAADRPESIELVLAAGLLHAPGPDVADGLRVHLISRPVRILPDPATGELVCTLTGAIRLEDDELLSGLPIYETSGSTGMARRLSELTGTPLGPGLETFLHEWSLRALTTTCAVDPGWAPPGGPAVRLAAAPALVARRRGASAVREHYDAMLRALRDEQVPVPPGLAQLVRPVEPAQRRAWLERAGADVSGIDDPLFPLPATAAQARILTRLGGDAGVVVAGAAGTGKTRTAANLLGALLARGQRVLVTGERAAPLRLLAETLPPGVRELCATVTDRSAADCATTDLAATIATLAAQRAEFDAERADQRIAALTDRRDDAAQEHARRQARLRATREFETLVHPEIAPGYGGTPAQIARTLARTAERDGWLPGPARGRPPVDEAELAELVDLLHTATPARAARRDQHLPDAVPPADTFAALVAAIRRGRSAQAGADPELVTLLERLPAGARPDIVGAEVVGAIAALRALPGMGAWAVEITDSLLAGGGRTHGWERATAQLIDVEQALAQDRVAGPAQVEVRGDVQPASAAGVLERLADHLGEGAALRRMFKSPEQRDAERLGSGVLVDGAPPRTRDAAAAAANHLRVLDTARNIDAAFSPLRTGLPLGADRGYLVDAMVALREACTAVGRVRTAAGSMTRLLGSLPPPVLPVPAQVAVLEELGAAALAVGPVRDAARAGRELDAMPAALQAGTDPAPETGALLDALRRFDVDAYGAALAALPPARRERDDQRRCDALLGRLQAATPGLEMREDAEWVHRLPRWHHAWARACAATWLAERTAQQTGDVAESAAQLDAVTADLAAERAWRACLGRMDEDQVQALAAHRHATARLAEGAGPHAERFRGAAAAAAAVVAPAVPAWIMSIQQVLARTNPSRDRFDVVIVDDADLCDLTSVFLLWLAPRVIVLGDDGQQAAAPLTASSSVLDRIDVELPDIPAHLRAAFVPGADLLSLLRTRYGPVERLPRDYRGRPGVLAWSTADRDGPPAPVRPPSPTRPVRATHVPDGRVEPVAGGTVNRAEARAIAESVVSQAATGGAATFGVITLLGRPQADLITEELTDRLAPTEWMRRRVRVGVPGDFQGDERDVVWLGTGVAPNAPSGSSSRRALTIAASRARDLLWLYHSVAPDELDPTDVRRSLLEHVLASPAPTVRRGDLTPFAARVRADLTALGHRVEPQVALDGRVVDLVVTAPAGTLVVICDGEARRVSAQGREAEQESEQELRRSGWLIERVRESAYLVDAAAALGPVLAALHRLAIRPPAGPSPMVTALLPTGSVVTRRLPTTAAERSSGAAEDSETDPETDPVTGRVVVSAGSPEPVTAAAPVIVAASAATEAVPVVLPTEEMPVRTDGPLVPTGVGAGPVARGPARVPHLRCPADDRRTGQTPTAPAAAGNSSVVGGSAVADRTGPSPNDLWFAEHPPTAAPAPARTEPEADVDTPSTGSVVVPPPRADRERMSGPPVSQGRHALIEAPAEVSPPAVVPPTEEELVETDGSAVQPSPVVPEPREGDDVVALDGEVGDDAPGDTPAMPVVDSTGALPDAEPGSSLRRQADDEAHTPPQPMAVVSAVAGDPDLAGQVAEGLAEPHDPRSATPESAEFDAPGFDAAGFDAAVPAGAGSEVAAPAIPRPSVPASIFTQSAIEEPNAAELGAADLEVGDLEVGEQDVGESGVVESGAAERRAVGSGVVGPAMEEPEAAPQASPELLFPEPLPSDESAGVRSDTVERVDPVADISAAEDPGSDDVQPPPVGPAPVGQVPVASLPMIRDLRSVPTPAASLRGYPSMFDAPLVAPTTNPVLPEEVQVEDRRFLLYAAGLHPLTSRWVARALAVEVAEARTLLRSMTEEGLLRHIVAVSGTHYVLGTGSVTTPAPTEVRGRERVLGTARERPLTVAAVRNLLGVGADSAREILADLVAQGDLEQRGHGRVVHYVPAGAA